MKQKVEPLTQYGRDGELAILLINSYLPNPGNIKNDQIFETTLSLTNQTSTNHNALQDRNCDNSVTAHAIHVIFHDYDDSDR